MAVVWLLKLNLHFKSLRISNFTFYFTNSNSFGCFKAKLYPCSWYEVKQKVIYAHLYVMNIQIICKLVNFHCFVCFVSCLALGVSLCTSCDCVKWLIHILISGLIPSFYSLLFPIGLFTLPTNMVISLTNKISFKLYNQCCSYIFLSFKKYYYFIFSFVILIWIFIKITHIHCWRSNNIGLVRTKEQSPSSSSYP